MKQTQDSQLLTDKAQEALWNTLRSGKLRDGQFLSISQLVDLLGYPIAAVRDAVKHASTLGLLTTLPKRGVQVMEVRPETIRECLDFRLVLDQEGARRRISQNVLSGLDDLRQRHEEMGKTAEKAKGRNSSLKAVEVDLSLHDYLAEGLGNSLLATAYSANRMRMAIIQNVRPFLLDRIKSAMEEHLSIMDALVIRDAEAVAQAIRYHHDQTLRWWGVT